MARPPVTDVLRDAILPRSLRASQSTSPIAIGLVAALLLLCFMVLLLFRLNPHR
jgi:hypothetical protein